MAAETVQHVVQKADAGIDVAFAGPVQVQRHGDLGLAGLAFDGCSAHGGALSQTEDVHITAKG